MGGDDRFGPYRLVEMLGRGGMGEVWRAYDTQRERTVALKLLAAGWADVPVFRERFRREARAAAGLASEHVVVIHDHGEIDGRLFIDMRLVTGGDLAGLLRAGHGLEPHAAVDLTLQIADGLHAAHRAGLVHRDVKPSNVLLAPDVTGHRAYLVDFGIAKLADETVGAGLTATGTTLGTPAYMAPELFTETGAATTSSDVYALGCVLFEMLTGRRPFPGTTAAAQMAQHIRDPAPAPSSVRADLAPFDAVVARAMDKDPAGRHPDATALARHARAAASGTPRAPGGAGPVDGGTAVLAPAPWWRRRRVLTGAVVLLVVAVAVVGSVVAGSRTERVGATPAVSRSASVATREPVIPAFTSGPTVSAAPSVPDSTGTVSEAPDGDSPTVTVDLAEATTLCGVVGTPTFGYTADGGADHTSTTWLRVRARSVGDDPSGGPSADVVGYMPATAIDVPTGGGPSPETVDGCDGGRALPR